MCGRYQLRAHPEELIEHFGAEILKAFHFAPRYNAAPTDPMPIVRRDRESAVRELATARWGLIPAGSRDPGIGVRMINARSETAATKPSFRNAFRHRRCLVPAQGFYEWRRTGTRKQPYHIGPADGSLFGFGALWEEWASPDGELVDTFTILTTDPNDLVRPLHDRMPVVIAPADYERWLVVAPDDAETLTDLLAPPDPAGWRAYPVTPAMNRAEHDAPDCIEEIGDVEAEPSAVTRRKSRASENLDLFD